MQPTYIGTRVVVLSVLVCWLAMPSFAEPESNIPPSTVRLTFWLPPDLHEEFALIFDEQLLPVVRAHGLVPSKLAKRATMDSAFCRLFDVADFEGANHIYQAIRADSVWMGSVSRAAVAIGLEAGDAQDQWWFDEYRIWAGEQDVHPLTGSGIRQGLWHSYTHRDGLPAPSVTSMMQDLNGDLWIGSWGALNRFDGARFVTVRAGGLTAHQIVQDATGVLWFYDFGLVHRLEDGWLTTYDRTDGVPAVSFGNYLGPLAVDRSGRLWIGGGETLGYLADGLFVPADLKELPGNVVHLTTDHGGNLWVATEEGIARRQIEGWTPIRAPQMAGSILRIDIDAKDQVWAVMEDHSLWVFTDQAWERIAKIPVENINNVLVDRQGQAWVSSGGEGVFLVDKNRVVHRFSQGAGLAGNEVRSILEDRDGAIWVGTLSGGISRYDGHRFRYYTTADGLPTDYVFAIARTQDGTLWFGGLGGVSRFDGVDRDSLVFYDNDDGLSGDRIWRMVADRSHGLWLGAEGGGNGVTFMDGQSFTDVTAEGPDPSIRAMAQSRDGEIWLISSDGLFRGWHDGFRQIPDVSGALGTDRSGNLLIATADGLVRHTGGQEDIFSDPFIKTPRSVYSIHFDGKDIAWFGMWRGSLLRYHDGRLDTFSVEDGLPPGQINHITEDEKGVLWITDFGYGLLQFDGTVFQLLSRREGLSDNGTHASLVDDDGSVWIATDGGITHYRPSSRSPSVGFTQIVADHRYAPGADLEFTTDQSLITVHFQGRSLTTPPTRMAYVYRFVGGEDGTWRASYDNQIDLEDLIAGKYTFEVRAIDQDLNYSDTAAIELTIRPPYGKWALISSLGVSLVALFGVGSVAVRRRRDYEREQRRRLEAQEALNRELEEELQTAHDMQMSLMPTSPPQTPGFDIAGRCEPFNHVGGDFYQYFERGDRLSLALADVTGHAMEAAIPVVMFSGMLDNQMETPRELPELFGSLNRSLTRSTDRRTYICFSMVEIDTASRSMTIANGGCHYPLHYHATDDSVTELQVDAYPLGVRVDTQYVAITAQLEPGDYLVMYSDGIPEAMNAQSEMFGFDRTIEAVRLACRSGLAAEGVVSKLFEATRSFLAGRNQDDDMTCVVLHIAS